MSARSVPAGTREALTGAAVVLAGTGVLLARPFVAGSPASRTALFAASYLAIGLASAVLPAAPGRAATRLGVRPALAVGLLAVAAAVAVAGEPVPVPWGAEALPLALGAAVAEEALFRRAAYGRLERFGAPLAVGVTAIAFALVHLPAYGLTALPVDLAAGLLLSWQRWASGTWLVPAATHAAANLVAVLR
ncbi:MAG: CPBP family intramembrane glutamic endopeptidase [Actinomycetota bacterium]